MSPIPPAASGPSALPNKPDLAIKLQGDPVYTAAVSWLQQRGFKLEGRPPEAIVLRELKIRGLGDKLKLSFKEGKFSFKELSLTGRLKRILHLAHKDTRLKKMEFAKTGRTAFQVFKDFNNLAKLNEIKLAEAAIKAKEKQAEVAKASRPSLPPFVKENIHLSMEEKHAVIIALKEVQELKEKAQKYLDIENAKDSSLLAPQLQPYVDTFYNHLMNNISNNCALLQQVKAGDKDAIVIAKKALVNAEKLVNNFKESLNVLLEGRKGS